MVKHLATCQSIVLLGCYSGSNRIHRKTCYDRDTGILPRFAILFNLKGGPVLFAAVYCTYMHLTLLRNRFKAIVRVLGGFPARSSLRDIYQKRVCGRIPRKSKHSLAVSSSLAFAVSKSWLAKMAMPGSGKE